MVFLNDLPAISIHLANAFFPLENEPFSYQLVVKTDKSNYPQFFMADQLEYLLQYCQTSMKKKQMEAY